MTAWADVRRAWGVRRTRLYEERTMRGVVFDWGGVLMRTVDASGRRKWERRLGLPLYAVDRVVHGSRSWKQAQSGLITDEAYWADVAAQLGLDEAALAEFRHDYFSGDRLDEEMVHFVRGLRPRHKTALLSNASPRLMQTLERLGVTDAFDVIVVSGLVGVQKPDPAIYRILLKRLALPPDQTLFVDDFIENIKAARALGMHTLHFQPGVDWRAVVEHWLEGGNCSPSRRLDVFPRRNRASNSPSGLKAHSTGNLREGRLSRYGRWGMTQGIIFDYGNVLALPQDPAAWEAHLDALGAELGFANGAALWSYLYEGKEWLWAKTGRITDAEFWRRLLEPCGLTTSTERRAWVRRLFEPGGVHPRMRQLVTQLQERYKLALLSNASDWLVTALDDELQLAQLFDVVVVSAAVGMAKPDPAIYWLTLERLGLPASAVLFIDDQARNTQAAEALGIPSILFTGVEALWSELTTRGLL